MMPLCLAVIANGTCTLIGTSTNLEVNGLYASHSDGHGYQFFELTWVDPEVERVVGLMWYGYAEEVPMTARAAVDEVLVSLP